MNHDPEDGAKDVRGHGRKGMVKLTIAGAPRKHELGWKKSFLDLDDGVVVEQHVEGVQTIGPSRMPSMD